MSVTWTYAAEVADTSMYTVALMQRMVRYVPDTRYWRRRIEWRKRMNNRRRARPARAVRTK